MLSVWRHFGLQTALCAMTLVHVTLEGIELEAIVVAPHLACHVPNDVPWWLVARMLLGAPGIATRSKDATRAIAHPKRPRPLSATVPHTLGCGKQTTLQHQDTSL